jgi:hypothetical protein
MSNTIELVEISADRLEQLEKLESQIPTMIQDALKEYKQAALRRLHEKDKANPEAVNLRARRYAQKNREILNAKRREKRRLERIAKEEKKIIENKVREPVTIALSYSTAFTSNSSQIVDSSEGKIVSFD